MRKVIVTEFVSLDGIMEDPGGAESYKYGGWSMPYDTGMYKFDELFASDAQLLGRVTYQGFSKAWPTMEGTGEFGERMNSMPKYVVSTTLKESELKWNNSHLIKGNLVGEVSRLKQQPGQDILVAGSARLVQSLVKQDLVDEYHLLVYPLVLGSGKRLFADVDKATLKLIEAKPLDSGVVLFIYQPDRKA
jgi:dihydrofolate reductase